MAYRSIAVNLDIDGDATSTMKLAVDLAVRMEARLIGLSAADVPPPPASPEGMSFDSSIMVQQRDDIAQHLDELHRKLRKLAGKTTQMEWRGKVGDPTRLLVDTARTADLIVTAPPGGGHIHRTTDLGGLILEAGRPILVTSTNQEEFRADSIVVAWNDTREARRAVVDAMPFLKLAREIRVITIAHDVTDKTWNSLNDVAALLDAHGVKAETKVIAEKSSRGNITEVAERMHPDLVVSGAFGHSRLREWIFGGATRSLLENNRLCRFMSN